VQMSSATKAALQGFDIRLTTFGQVVGAAHLISECIGSPQSTQLRE